MPPSQGGLVNTQALAGMYDNAVTNKYEDATIEFWNALFSVTFPPTDWGVVPHKYQISQKRPDFVIRRWYSSGGVVEVVVVEGKPQAQTEGQDAKADDQVLGYAVTALKEGPSDQKKIYAMRVVGVLIMVYEVYKNQPDRLQNLLQDYKDPKKDVVVLNEVFERIRTVDMF
ncbi:MAG: hypothetical protein M1834_009018 [Cirrosporium novae-zelandiae]|nr:MAG: hypothetical protein M1834_009018 [Cirrosporium novae-zelandiae]